MRIVAVDDEELALAVLCKSIEAAIADAEITSFGLPGEALEYIENNNVDAVFCDYNMPKMNGIAFAKAIKAIKPQTDIVFVTGYEEYAIEAVNAVSPKGYIVKPVSKKKVETVLANLHETTQGSGLFVQTFGMFNVLYNGNPLKFQVKKSLELFAYLINSGGTCTRRELTAVLYEDKEEENAVRYFKDAVRSLVSALDEVGQKDVLIRGFNSYSVDRSKIQCDLYDFLAGNVNLFRGEYMSQYSWAEFEIPNILK